MTTARPNCSAKLLGALLGCASIACSAAEPSVPPPLSSDATELNRHIVTSAFHRWSEGGKDFFREILDPAVVWTIKGSGPSAGVYRGADALIKRAVSPLAARLSTPVRPIWTKVWADRDFVIVQWDGEGRARDGVIYRNSYVWIFRMSNSKAIEVTAYLDLIPYNAVLDRIPVRN